jgi:hypothetical protein
MLGGTRGLQMMYIRIAGFMLKCKATDAECEEVFLADENARRTFRCVTVEFARIIAATR